MLVILNTGLSALKVNIWGFIVSNQSIFRIIFTPRKIFRLYKQKHRIILNFFTFLCSEAKYNFFTHPILSSRSFLRDNGPILISWDQFNVNHKIVRKIKAKETLY
jgi:hypothetical protein